MTRTVLHIAVGLLATFTASADTNSIPEARLQLIENQRNILYLRKEKQHFTKELKTLLTGGSQNDIQETKDNIALTDSLITNISLLVSQQRLALARREKGSPPSALDIALNKALSADLPELARKLSSNKEAKKEILRLSALLKQQAFLGIPTMQTQTSVFLALEQHVAEAEFLKLLSLFSAGTADDSADKPIKITWIAERTPYSQEETLSYLGHGQYHTQTTVYRGKMTFTVDGRPWQLNVSREDDNANYVIIYDDSQKSEPRLVMFNKSLLLE